MDKLAMLKRREFLGCLTALGGSYLLTACGGGSGSPTGGAITNAAAPGSDVAAKAVAVANAAVSAASANNTTVPSATLIVDSTGATWTLVKGSVFRNGVAAGNTYNVTMLLYYGNGIYHQGSGGQFYQYTNSNWVATLDPRLGGTSPDGTTIPSGTYIIDSVNAMWTVVNGVIFRNGATVGNTYNVTLLLWYGGKIWHKGTGGQFYVLTSTFTWVPCSDPRIPSAATAGSFYGMNGHWDYLYTPAQVISMLKSLGCTSYRVGCTSNSTEINAVVKLAQAFKAAGMTLFVLIDQGLTDASGNLFANENVAYSTARATGVTVAGALAPYGVTIYECGNELTRQNSTVLNFSCAGDKASDFNNAGWPVMRGVMRGLIDGVKSVQPGAKCGINFCVADVGASDALWDGMQPDGSGGHPTVRWDITTWHNYQVYGDIFNIAQDGASPGFNLPAYCKARYGVPFIISEWNCNPENGEDFRGSYVTAQLGEFYQARKTHNLQSVMYYDLESGDYTYGIVHNSVPINPPFTAFSSFTAAHRDN
jgi:hypothetical protein